MMKPMLVEEEQRKAVVLLLDENDVKMLAARADDGCLIVKLRCRC